MTILVHNALKSLEQSGMSKTIAKHPNIGKDTFSIQTRIQAMIVYQSARKSTSKDGHK